MEGFDAVIHLAALSNDPLGNLNTGWTEDINFKASWRLAGLAKSAGVNKFLFSSSCIMYGMSENAVATEESPLDPQTEYARSKVKSEEAISKLTGDGFSPVFLRNGTVYGLSPRMRFDTVLNDLVASAVTTSGNPDTQLILRGGANGPNFDAKKVAKAVNLLETSQVPVSVMIDCSHGNSAKAPKRQPAVLRDVLGQIQAGNRAIHAVMIESNLKGGSQTFPAALEDLEYGVSITDGCLDWESTEEALRQAHEAMAIRF